MERRIWAMTAAGAVTLGIVLVGGRRNAEPALEPIALESQATAEAAGYDPPFTPGFMRRNEVLIRIQVDTPTTTTSETQPAAS